MTTSTDRLRLYEHARETWDEPTARTLMDLLPDDAAQLATKADLGLVRSELRGEMAELRSELRGEMAELRADLRGEMAELRVEVHDGFAAQTRTLTMWMISMSITCITFSVGSVLAAAALT